MKALSSRLRALFRKQQLDTEMAEEMRSHIEMQTQENIDSGMNEKEARFAALKQFGWMESIKETCREQRTKAWVNGLTQDVRFGLRMLRKYPGFACVVVLTLSLGIGAVTAVFSVIDALLLRPLPYKNSSRLVMVWGVNPQYKANDVTLRFGEFKTWQQQNTVFDAMSLFTLNNFTLTDLQNPEQVEGARCSASLFPLLGVEPLLGRIFTQDEEDSGAPVAVIGETLWRRRYGADRNVIGRVVRLTGRSCEIIGILPTHFQFPRRGEMRDHYVASGVEMWLPTDQSPAGAAMRANENRFFVLAKLKPHVTVDQAQREIEIISARMAKAHPEYVSKLGVNVASLQEQTVGNVRGVLVTLLGAMAFVLLIACANSANLLLVRGADRQREIAIRLAIGSNRLRLTRQLLTESLLLSFVAAMLGLLLAWAVFRLLLVNNPVDLPRWDEVELSWGVLIFTLGVAVSTGILFGLLPALHAFAPDLAVTLRSASKAGAMNRTGVRSRQMLVLAEVSLVFVLLAGMALMIQSFRKVLSTELGFRREQLLTFDVPLPEAKYRESWKKEQFFRGLLQRFEVLPGIESVGATHIAPFRGEHAVALQFEGEPVVPFSNPPFTSFRMVSDNYLETMGLTLLQGRRFTAQRNPSGVRNEFTPGEVIVNESFAHTFCPNSDPLGKRLKLGGSDRWWTVIGVLKDFKNISLESKPRPEAYVNSMFLPTGITTMTFVIRTHGEPLMLAGVVRREVAEMDREQPIQNLQSMERILSHANASRRLLTLLISASGSVGLVLAVIGIYAVIAFSVRQRTHEFGIRMALGAPRADVLTFVLKRGITLIVPGLILGALGAVALTRLVQSLLFEVNPTDPLIFTIVAIGLGMVGLVACFVPAFRAARVNPMLALRCE